MFLQESADGAENLFVQTHLYKQIFRKYAAIPAHTKGYASTEILLMNFMMAVGFF